MAILRISSMDLVVGLGKEGKIRPNLCKVHTDIPAHLRLMNGRG